VIERVVENWLTSANERQYQIPFCQVLASEGETVLYISSHGALEQGKDIVTLGPEKVPRAYQLKSGNLKLPEWQRFKGEIDELVELPISTAIVRSRQHHRPYFVTNGRIGETVLNRIETANKVWRRHNPRALQAVQGHELVSRFIKAHGSFLPRETEAFSNLLELIVNSGAGPFDKARFSEFLESTLRLSGASITPRDAGRSITNAVLLTSYIVQNCERAGNHWALFEAWVVTASYILAMASKYRMAAKWWNGSFALCCLAAVRALDALCQECAGNQTAFIQGDPLTDGDFYPMRMTILAGTLSALSLYHRLKSEKWERQDYVHDFLSEHIKDAKIWGESATPYMVAAALELEHHGAHRHAERLIVQMMHSILALNSQKGRGFANPYYGPEQVFRLFSGMDPMNSEVFIGHSYHLEALIEMLARRLLRTTLAHFWEKITRVHFTWFKPAEDWQWFRWHTYDGILEQKTPNAPQSWSALLEASEGGPIEVPALLRDRPEFAVLFMLVFPHRFGVGLMRLIDHALQRV
jgi:hypothetical protein